METLTVDAHQEIGKRMLKVRRSIDEFILDNYEGLLGEYNSGNNMEYWSRLAHSLYEENRRLYGNITNNHIINDLNAFVGDEVLTAQSYFSELTGELERRFIREHHKLPYSSPEWKDFYQRNRTNVPDGVLV